MNDTKDFTKLTYFGISNGLLVPRNITDPVRSVSSHTVLFINILYNQSKWPLQLRPYRSDVILQFKISNEVFSMNTQKGKSQNKILLYC